MDAELDRRWRTGGSPFDGLTYAARASLPITRVRVALEILVYALEHSSNEAAPEPPSVVSLRDWHFAGGAITTAKPCSWSEVRYWLRSDNGLFQARTGEEDVFISVYSRDFPFLLRFYVDPEVSAPGEPLEGRFDVTAREGLARSLASVLRQGGVTEFVEVPASEFFALPEGASER